MDETDNPDPTGKSEHHKKNDTQTLCLLVGWMPRKHTASDLRSRSFLRALSTPAPKKKGNDSLTDESDWVSSHVWLCSPWTAMQPARLLCPWNATGQNTGVGSLFLLQGIFPTQELNSGFPHCRGIFYCLSYQEKPLGRTKSLIENSGVRETWDPCKYLLSLVFLVMAILTAMR